MKRAWMEVLKQRFRTWWEAKRQERKFYREMERDDELIRKAVPYICAYCELLGLCRDREKGWKCHHGCLILNAERAEAERRKHATE